MEIKRDAYLQQLIDRMGNGMIKVITGMRRVGKSYLLNHLFYQHLITQGVDDRKIIRFDFSSAIDLNRIGEHYYELKKNREKVDPSKFVGFIHEQCKEEGSYYLLLDEVQEMDGFEWVLNGFLSEGKFDVYVTGSNAKFLVKDIVTEFRGRGDKIHVLPLSFSECWTYYDENKQIALEKYVNFGGLPLAVTSSNDKDKIKYIKTQIDETYLTDIIDRYQIRNTVELDTLFNILASGIAGLVNPKKLSAAFKSRNLSLSEQTIANYIRYFEDAFLIDVASRYNVKGKSYISTPYKIYFEDLGVRNARIDFRQTERTHIMENLIYNELRYRGYSVDVGEVEIRKTMKDASGISKQVQSFLEVDFVANEGSKRYYIQSAYQIPDSEKLAQETKPLLSIGDSFKKMVIVYDYIVPHYDEHGIFYMGLLDFLTDPRSLER